MAIDFGSGSGAGLGDDNVAHGVADAFTRLAEEGFHVSEAHEDQYVSSVRDSLAPFANQWPPRAMRLSAEHLTIATVARATYSEEPLTTTQIEDFLKHSSMFFNSFWHGAP